MALYGARPRGGPQSAPRQFTAEYKKSILDEADSAKQPGAIGAMLRREGLYSSHLTHWRQQRDSGLAVHRRGPKPKYDPLSEEVRKLKLQNSQLTQRLARAELIIDVQKKVSLLLGIPMATIDSGREHLMNATVEAVPSWALLLPVRLSVFPAPLCIVCKIRCPKRPNHGNAQCRLAR